MPKAEFDEVDSIIRYESGELKGPETLDLFQHLVNNGHAWTLQGHYGRLAKTLLAAGLIKPAKNVLGAFGA